jgi:hypothetical protein
VFDCVKHMTSVPGGGSKASGFSKKSTLVQLRREEVATGDQPVQLVLQFNVVCVVWLGSHVCQYVSSDQKSCRSSPAIS